jgi:hypothetical protein
MLKKVTLLLCLSALGISACTKNSKNTACNIQQACTEEFRSFGIQFVNSAGDNVEVKDVTVVNLRTNKPIVARNVLDPGFSPNIYFVATDSNKDEFSSEGDEVKITATSTGSNKTAFAIVKISGGSCNCHISKISGPDKIVF